MALNKFKKLLIIAVSLFAGCQQPDYAIVTADKGETVYVEIEVPGETEYIEVEIPVYIEVEVPVEHGEIWIDSFTQSQSTDGVDILWIIDTSGSMYRYDPQLLAGIEAMLAALPASGWRLNMISNHPTCAATDSQFPLVPGDDIIDATNMLNSMCTGGMEEGFDSAYEYIINNPYSHTWMRPTSAALLIVFVSDEEEQSDTHLPLVSDFTWWYSMLRSPGSTYVASVINKDPTESLCINPPNLFDVGNRYMEATNFFGGTIVDICDEDWSAGVTDASNNIEPKESLELTHAPDPVSAIRVFINGSLNHDWYYDSSDNTIYFTVIPSGGDLVEIGYLYFEASDTGDTGQ
jgi:hypothetical protein